jgi:predicted amidohydrolase YtcJ
MINHITQSRKARVALATLLSAFLTLSSAQADDTAPDLIVVNADIHTADPAQPRASAMAIRDGRFMAVGKTPEILRLAGPKTRVISVDGRSVTPGFIDGHSHMGGNAPRVAGVDLSYIVDKSDWLKEIAAAHQRLPAGEWLTGGYWDHTLSDGIYPDRAMLDAITPDRPVFLTHIDGHYAWVNSKACWKVPWGSSAGSFRNVTSRSGGRVLQRCNASLTALASAACIRWEISTTTST